VKGSANRCRNPKAGVKKHDFNEPASSGRLWMMSTTICREHAACNGVAVPQSYRQVGGHVHHLDHQISSNLAVKSTFNRDSLDRAPNELCKADVIGKSKLVRYAFQRRLPSKQLLNPFIWRVVHIRT
jgi:hypothetical protein